MPSESTLAKLANHVLESVELVAARAEEGLALLMAGSKVDGDQAGFDDGPFDNDDVTMEMDEDMIGSPLEGIADSVLSDIMSKQSGPQTPMEHFGAFRTAITWSEPFIISLIAFQVIAFATCLYMSRRGRGMVPRLVTMVIVAILVRCAELLNGYGARNWESLCTQNYFDKGGIFVGIMLCGPLLLDCFIMLTLLIREASSLLIEVKKMELKKSREKKEGDSSGKAGRGKKNKSKSKKDD